MKVYVVADLEGVSGVGGFDVRDVASALAADRRGRWLELWAGEVNAAVEGAVAAGAGQVLVLDNHGSGDSLPADLLHASARLVHGTARPTWLPLLDDSVHAVLIVGQHAMAGCPRGHLCHTYSRRRLDRVSLNGTEIGEIGLIAGIAGEAGVPVVFLSGDDGAAAEMGGLARQVETVAVKQSLSRRACVSLSPGESRERIRAGVGRALARRDGIAPVCFAPPLWLRVRYRRRDGWRAGARWLKGGLRDGWWGRELRLSGDRLGPLWDRFVGAGE